MDPKTPPVPADLHASTPSQSRTAPVACPVEATSAMSRRTFFGAAGAVGATLACASAPAAETAQGSAIAVTPSGSGGAPTSGAHRGCRPGRYPFDDLDGIGRALGRHRHRISRNSPRRLLPRMANPQPRSLGRAQVPRTGQRRGRHAAQPPLSRAYRQTGRWVAAAPQAVSPQRRE